MRTTLKPFSILDIDGAVLHAGEGRSWGDFVEGLVRAERSLARADLREATLQHLSLDGADLRGACLDGADLTGSSLCGAYLDGASLRGIVGDGLRAQNAVFALADLGPLPVADGHRHTTLMGADLDAAVLRRVRLHGADLTGASLRAVKFLGAEVERARFAKADLYNSDFAWSRFVACDFTEADLTSHTGAPEAALLDRTEGLVAIDNVYKGARLDRGVRGFRSDRLAATVMRRATFGVSALAVAAMASVFPEEGMHHAAVEAVSALAERVPLGSFGHLVGGGFALVLGVKIANLLREKVEEVARHVIGRRLLPALSSAKRYVAEVAGRGGEIADLVAAVAWGPGARFLKPALHASEEEARRGGLLGLVREVAAGKASIILCDRRHLAMALTRLHVEQTRGQHLGRDLVLVRDTDPTVADDAAPVAYRMCRDGSSCAVWGPSSRPRHVAWGPGGEVILASGFYAEVPGAAATRASFEAALWKDHGLSRTYVSGSHQIAAGRDGSILVIQERTGLLSNPQGAAYVGPDGTQARYRSGEPVAEAGWTPAR